MEPSEALRQAIETCGRSRYRLSKETGIDPAVLCRFVHRQAGLSLDSIDALAAALGLELRPVKPARATKPKRTTKPKQKRG
ncbi:MAG: helix-turn-helix domain-containing protein [Thermoguttaceae bacterium]|jgi:ribosome-binding protein aMBF1 (putative translation factor)|nr:helix-turn-helix domain-containing protein [Thermoguttaceae bacterium]